jgi:IS30 family transposase
MRYRHLIQEERYQISALKEAGWSQGAIAAKLGRHPSSISRELNRNRAVGPYRPQVAELLAAAHSQQSAANENLNGLLRQFFPKHRKLEEVTDDEIALAQHRLNHRPRKCLGYKTPHQVFWKQLHSNQPVALRC